MHDIRDETLEQAENTILYASCDDVVFNLHGGMNLDRVSV